MPPAARITDMVACPMVTPALVPVPHVGGPIITGAATVITGFMPQARVTDLAQCVGPPAMIIKGSPTVFVEYLMAARIGDPTNHGGAIVTGHIPTLIGDVGMGGMGSGAAGGMDAAGAGGQGLVDLDEAPDGEGAGAPTDEGQILDAMGEAYGDPLAPAFPDMPSMPSPGGPIPIPYPHIGAPAAPAAPTPMTAPSQTPPSQGDESGTMKGVVSPPGQAPGAPAPPPGPTVDED